IISDISCLKNGDTLIITAHGASKKIWQFCKDNGIKIVDTTCPFVKVLHDKASEYYKKGYQIVIIGNKEHPEIIGVNGWCDNSAIITDGSKKIDLTMFDKVFVLFQTTFNVEKVETAIENLVKDNNKILEIFNTICYTTTERQKSAAQIASQCDSVIVVGGKNSSNTRRLAEICSRLCKQVASIERADELKNFDFSHTENIGIIAGASTPSELIEEVLAKMAEQTKDNNIETVMSDKELFESAIENFNRKSLKKGQKLKGRITFISDAGINLNFDFSKKEGFIPNDEIALDGDYQAVKANLKEGETIEVVVLSADKDIILSRKAIEELYKDDALVEEIKQGKEFSLVASRAVNGGLLSKLGSYTVFVPASQIRSGFVKDLSKYVGKKLRLVALPDGIDDSKRKIVASQKVLIEAEKKAKEDNFWSNIEVGEIVEGQVVRFASFGAFVNVRGFDCLAHVSDLSWTAVKDPSEVLELNKTYEFVVLKLDRESNRVSIGYKQLLPDPWQIAYESFPVGSVT
ncbi:MAG: 4-hydroxy-3-methylbut-2-enyl diphosphate reductase, partial [Clostridia bacterium]|nr:4-hydroxy-3-methylbut-2-enyl diphosphate reductase [Clostridia bacterium]